MSQQPQHPRKRMPPLICRNFTCASDKWTEKTGNHGQGDVRSLDKRVRRARRCLFLCYIYCCLSCFCAALAALHPGRAVPSIPSSPQSCSPGMCTRPALQGTLMRSVMAAEHPQRTAHVPCRSGCGQEAPWWRRSGGCCRPARLVCARRNPLEAWGPCPKRRYGAPELERPDSGCSACRQPPGRLPPPSLWGTVLFSVGAAWARSVGAGWPPAGPMRLLCGPSGSWAERSVAPSDGALQALSSQCQGSTTRAAGQRQVSSSGEAASRARQPRRA